MDFIIQFEAEILQLYDDLGPGQGNCTIGVGHLVHEGPCDFSETNPTEAPYIDGITEEESRNLFAEDIGPIETAVNEAITVNIQQNQFDAIVSFAFNAGENNLAAWEHISYINESDFTAADEEWRKTAIKDSTGTEIEGLKRRRQFEADLFTNGTYRTDW